MKNLFKRLFGKHKGVAPDTLSEAPTEFSLEEQNLNTLANAICDVGYWSWWVTELPELIQVEFGGTQLYFPPDDPLNHPSSQIAIRFKNPKSISFLTKRKLVEGAENWFDLLHQDKVEPITCDYDHFTFTDVKLMNEIIHQAETIQTIHGYSPRESSFMLDKYKLVFWAGDYGMAIAADELAVRSKEGFIELIQVPAIHSQWWEYWKRYWDAINTENPLPSNYACEVTIPIANFRLPNE